MINLKKYFIEHPNSVNMTYLEHWYFATKAGFKLLFAGCVCIIHAFIPFMFTKTTSKIICDMYDCLKDKK